MPVEKKGILEKIMEKLGLTKEDDIDSIDTGYVPFASHKKLKRDIKDFSSEIKIVKGKLNPPHCFKWLIKDIIAGSAQIKKLNELAWLKENGIKAIVTLRLNPLDKNFIESLGFEYLFLPIVRVPSLIKIKLFLNFVNLMIAQNKPVLIHCRNGLGRTGMMLAMYLIDKGYYPDDAIKEIETYNPKAIEHYEQYAAIKRYFKIKEKPKEYAVKV